MNLESVAEEKIIELAKDGDKEAMEFLFDKYKNTVKSVARSYYLVGGDEDDIVQEGMIGLYSAVQKYNGEGPFAPYANKVVRNRIITLIRKSNQKKHIPLYNYISLSNQEDDLLKSEISIDETFEPERDYINKEAERELLLKIKSALTELENEILSLYLQGYSYSDISKNTNKNYKSIDNALQRIRKKITSITDKAI